MSMNTPAFWNATITEVRAGRLDVSFIDQAVRRLLETKFALGLFEDPRHPDKNKARERASSPFSRAQAQKLAEDSLVLLKNDGLLPLDASTIHRIAVVGPNSDDANQQLGDWARNQPRNTTITVLDGVRELLTGATVEHEKGCGIDPGEKGDLAKAIAMIKAADASIVVIGDRSHYYGERRSVATLELMGGQHQFLDAILETKKKFVLIVIGQKPLIIPQKVRDGASAIIWQFCPGNMGGRAAARAIFGQVNPSGRLAISIPVHVGQIPCLYYRFRYWHGGYADLTMAPAWPFGHGLGYSDIDYVSATLDKKTYMMGEDIHVTVTCHNKGKYDADEVIQVYVQDKITSVTWVEHLLKGYKRQKIAAGQQVTVDIVINVNDLWLINARGQRVVEPGAFEIRVARSSANIRYKLDFDVE
jgi:beta-glucosidase